MPKKVAILQSNYIPWKGYFDLINSVDEFIVYDEMQYTVDDWRNRNKVKTKQGVQWISIPVSKKGRLNLKINEVKIADSRWSKKHWTTLSNTYARSEHFKDYADLFEDIYLHKANTLESLSDINFLFMTEINRILGISTHMRQSTEFELGEGKSERLLNLCKQTDAEIYLSGPAASDYLDEEIFNHEGIDIQWMNYSNYPQYNQPHGAFEHGVTILDLLFNVGDEATRYMKSFGIQ
jgi:hypothetical protein